MLTNSCSLSIKTSLTKFCVGHNASLLQKTGKPDDRRTRSSARDNQSVDEIDLNPYKSDNEGSRKKGKGGTKDSRQPKSMTRVRSLQGSSRNQPEDISTQ